MPLGIYFLIVWILTLLLLGDFFGGGGPPIGPDMGHMHGGGGSLGLAEDPYARADIYNLELWTLPEEDGGSESSSENDKTPKDWSRMRTAIRIFYCVALFTPLVIGAGIVVVSVTP